MHRNGPPVIFWLWCTTLQSVEQALAPLQEELEERRKEKRKLTEEKETAEVLARTKMQELRTQVDSIHRSTDTIKRCFIIIGLYVVGLCNI